MDGRGWMGAWGSGTVPPRPTPPPNPNLMAPPFVDGWPLPASTLNELFGFLGIGHASAPGPYIPVSGGTIRHLTIGFSPPSPLVVGFGDLSISATARVGTDPALTTDPLVINRPSTRGIAQGIVFTVDNRTPSRWRIHDSIDDTRLKFQWTGGPNRASGLQIDDNGNVLIDGVLVLAGRIVSVGPPDSGGPGFRMLIVPNN